MKKELVKKLLEKRKEIKNKEDKDKMITYFISLIVEKYERIMIYYPISSEPNILDIINDKNKKFYLPYCNKENIEPRYLNDLNNLIKDDVNIYSSKIKTTDEVEVVIAPAVACNKEFYRLGYGGGYYDRYLQNKDLVKIVLVYDDLLTDAMFQEPFDIRFDYIITEKEIIKRK